MSILMGSVASFQGSDRTVEGSTSHAPLQRVPAAELSQCSSGNPLQNVHAIIIVFDDSYLKTLPGIIRVIQVVSSLICLIFLISSGHDNFDYLLLPIAGFLRLIVFTSVAGFLLSTIMIGIRVTHTIQIFPINWNTFDLVLYSLISVLFLISSSLAAHAVSVFQKMNSSHWTIQQLTGCVVSGFVCMSVYAVTAAFAFWKKIPHGPPAHGEIPADSAELKLYIC